MTAAIERLGAGGDVADCAATAARLLAHARRLRRSGADPRLAAGCEALAGALRDFALRTGGLAGRARLLQARLDAGGLVLAGRRVVPAPGRPAGDPVEQTACALEAARIVDGAIRARSRLRRAAGLLASAAASGDDPQLARVVPRELVVLVGPGLPHVEGDDVLP